MRFHRNVLMARQLSYLKNVKNVLVLKTHRFLSRISPIHYTSKETVELKVRLRDYKCPLVKKETLAQFRLKLKHSYILVVKSS